MDTFHFQDKTQKNSNFPMTHAIVTGANGFVGKHLVKMLQEKKIATLCISHKESKKEINSKINAFLNSKNIRGCVFFHLAAKTCFRGDKQDVEDLIHSNISFGATLLELIRFAKTRIHTIIVSSNAQNFDENYYSPRDFYASTKQAFEYIAQFYSLRHNLNITTISIPNIYGSGDNKSAISLLINSKYSKKPVKMGFGETEMDYLNVRDIVEALFFVGNEYFDRINYKKFFLSADSFTTLRQIEKIMLTYNYRTNVLWGALEDNNRKKKQFVRNNKLPNWKQAITIEEGIKELCYE